MEFSDERLSAYLDGELSADERLAFERHLAANPEQQQLLAELDALKCQVQRLPQLRLGDDFTRRVVAAALEAKYLETTEATLVRPASPSPRRSAWSTPFVAIPALAAAVLVAVMVFNRQWNGSAGPIQPIVVTPGPVSTVPAALAELRRATPGPNEALVVRLRVPKGTLDRYGVEAALVKSGIEFGRPAAASTAQRVGSSYRRQVGQLTSRGMADRSAHPSEVLFLEASLEQVEATLAELGGGRATSSSLQLEMIVNATVPDSDRAEGEGGSRNTLPELAPSGPVAHWLDAKVFPLPAAPQNDANPSLPQVGPAATVDLQRQVRVLVLIEATE